MLIKDQLSLFKTEEKGAKSERAQIISEFVEEINSERTNTKWPPITGREVAVRLSHVKDKFTLCYFLSECRDYKNRYGSFGKRFFGALKVR